MTVMDRTRGDVRFTYDNRFDVLRVFLKPFKVSNVEEISDNFYVHYDEESDEVLGFVIMDFKQWKIVDLNRLTPVPINYKKIFKQI